MNTNEIFNVDVLREAQSDQFQLTGYAALPSVLTSHGVEMLQAETARLRTVAHRRDFEMVCMDGTPRHMTTVGGRRISESSMVITEMYEATQMQVELSRLTGVPIELADDPTERHVLNFLHRAGDTHGRHVDDYPFALILFVEAPTCRDGCGELEFWDNDAGEGSPHVRLHGVGDGYLLRADRHAHQVRSVHDGCRRTVFNFAYGSPLITVNASPSASLLYD